MARASKEQPSSELGTDASEHFMFWRKTMKLRELRPHSWRRILQSRRIEKHSERELLVADKRLIF